MVGTLRKLLNAAFFPNYDRGYHKQTNRKKMDGQLQILYKDESNTDEEQLNKY